MSSIVLKPPNQLLSGLATVRCTSAPQRQTPASSVYATHYTVGSTLLPLVQDALPFAEQVRRALIRNRVDTSHSEAITGKHNDGTPLDGHEHAHYFPTDEDHDGRIDHITIYAARGFDEADLEALGSLSTIFRRGNRPEVRMVLTGLGGQELLSEVSIFGEARRWRSVTPFSLPRFTNRGGGKPSRPRDLPEGQLIREIKNRGLPEPVSVKRIEGYQVEGIPPEGGTTQQGIPPEGGTTQQGIPPEGGTTQQGIPPEGGTTQQGIPPEGGTTKRGSEKSGNTGGRPLVRWLEFHSTRYNGTKGNGLAGFEIEFAEPVRGPIALGFACHFGLGLFLPCS